MKRRLKTLSLLLLALMLTLSACGQQAAAPPQEESVEESAEKDAKVYQAGTYTGVGTGMAGPVNVEVTFDDNMITGIEIGEENETAGLSEQVYAILPARIMESQSLGVDSVSGATVTSSAIKSAVEDAVEQAGGDVSALRQAEVVREVVDEEFDYDVVVVGGGLAGLMASIEATKLGANVAILEKLDVLGGTSIYASGNLLGATEEQYQQPMFDAWQKRSASQEANPIDNDRLQVVVDRSPDVMSLMMDDAGVEFNIEVDEDLNFQTFRGKPNEKSIKNAEAIQVASKNANKKGGAQILERLISAAEEAGVDIYRATPATSLIQEDDGKVTGVISESKGGVKTFHAKAVLFTSGDYARNEEMTAKLAPQAIGEMSATAVSNTGDGHQMIVDAGGYYYDFQESMSGVFNANPFDMPAIGDPTNGYPFEALLLNLDGVRKYKEDGGSHPQKFQFVDPDRLNSAWAIMDEAIAEKFPRLEEYVEKTADGDRYIKVYKADTIEALADMMEVDQATVVESVNRYNEMVAQGEDTDFGKSPDFLDAIDEGPFYAAFLYDATRGNYGGIVTDAYGAVLDTNDEPIEGLFAGGIISSGPYFGDFYPGRQAIAIAAHMGFIAGETAANYALGME